MSTRSDITTGQNNKTAKQNVKDKIELSELIAMALSGDPEASNRLYEKCNATIKAVFLPKICKVSWKGIPIPDGIEELSIETFEKAVQSLADHQVDIHNPSFDLFKYFENVANKYWKHLVQKANQGNKEVIDRFYMLCRKQLIEFFKWNLGPYSHHAEDFCQSSYLIALEKILEKPYDPKYKIYSYFKYVMNAKFLKHRMKNGGIKPSGGVIYKHPFEVLSSEMICGDKNKDEIIDANVIDRVSDYSNAEEILLATEVITKRFKTKLTLLQYCAKQAKPHKFLAFGFNKWLECKTRDVVEKCSDKSFGTHSLRLFNVTYDMINFFMDKNELYEYFSPLLEKLDKETVLIYPEKAYLVWLNNYLNEKVKVLSFEIFYGKNPTANISDWSYRVKEIIKIELCLYK